MTRYGASGAAVPAGPVKQPAEGRLTTRSAGTPDKSGAPAAEPGAPAGDVLATLRTSRRGLCAATTRATTLAAAP